MNQVLVATPPLDLDENEVEISDNGAEEKHKIMESFAGAHEEFDVFKALVLVAIFQRDKVNKDSKILTSIKTQKEDVYQGRVGLVVKVGPGAFQDDKDVKFFGKKVEAGDWAVYTPENGRRLMLNGVECRLIEDVHIDGKLVDPYLLL